MSFQTFTAPNALFARSEHSNLNKATKRAVELIRELGVETIYIMEVNWTQSVRTRTPAGIVTLNNKVIENEGGLLTQVQ